MDSLPQDDQPRKQCRDCKQWLPATVNYFSPASKNGLLFAVCKDCRNIAWRLKHPNARPRGKKSSQIDVPEGHRRCTKCKGIFELNEGNFHVHSTQKSGFHPRCKACREEDTALYRQTLDKDEVSQYNKDYRIANAECLEAYDKVYRQKNAEYISQWQRGYRKDHPEQIRVYGHNRRARKRAAPGTHTSQQIREQYDRQHGQCYYCRCKIKWGKYHADHVVPLSRGGSNDISNIVLACPPCNQHKQSRMPHEWPEGGRLL